MRDLDTLTFPPAGECIYCGSRERLTDEHIVPYGLNGTAVLPQASCRPCATITGRVELDVLRGPMRAIRAYRRLKSRRPAEAQRTAEVVCIKDGVESIAEVPLDEHPLLLHFHVFEIAGELSGKTDVTGINLRGLITLKYGLDPEEVARRLKVDAVRVRSVDRPTSFARMIAKIAYAMAWADNTIEQVAKPRMLADSILGVRDDIGRWVGTSPAQLQAHPGILHGVDFFRQESTNALVSEVQLFADASTPRYHVVLGNLK